MTGPAAHQLAVLTESVIVAAMSRVTPPDRWAKLLDAAAAAFVEHGFHRTQMDDVAERLGVSKGTIYRAVDSKDALFAAVIAWGDDPDHASATAVTGSPNLGALASSITNQLAAAVAALELTAIVADRRRLRTAGGIADEIERVTAGLHRVMHARRTAIMVLDRCAGEIPELTDVWFGQGRYALVDLWADYLELRAAAIATDVDRAILARTIVEIITTWAVKMPWDRAPRPYPDDTAAACGTMIRHLVTGGT
jgi:AcrR family transcriptional regulator